MRLKMLVASCLILASSVVAAFADPTGSFQVVGKNADGGEYKGTVEVQRTGPT